MFIEQITLASAERTINRIKKKEYEQTIEWLRERNEIDYFLLFFVVNIALFSIPVRFYFEFY